MPYFKTSQEWLDQSKLLLEARPSTTRITTRYSIKPVKPRSSDRDSSTDQTAAAKPPRGSLVLKTYDPAGGVVLKYRTNKAAEVSRLIQSCLGSLGRSMAALPPVDETMTDAPSAQEAVADAAAVATAPAATAGSATGGGKPAQGGGKKKKGRK
ncbi:Signal recognition particle 9 kDa protein (SRP9) [Geosmithia morbida]|uniref:Signal recognition particle 9 kDa protein (SRP9) n=1 Tax=Geosmithia morbida TaxID=1094350 RepID=A0A9P4YWV2_9HYPO|nr:Signal recognition particle 9 kDa protein (SRP9) [Geosmithia morbida]KAF4123277.1 Signal recognition particle 9 kDa protein (SRP9) [Geosmithia morbida]